ncbi:MAG: toll/interleukin-1 receptor domain-containing protein [Prevotella sp.]|nr:toll/interleukin-1 receptor domain-containing protein [Prevotella sp.]
MESKDVFISYSRKDTEVANKICEAFDRAGITYFIDRQGIVGGMEFPEVLAEAILNCRLFLYLASNNSYASKFTNSEITFAFNKKSSNSLLPYIVDNSSLPVRMEFIFSSINWRNITDHPIDTTLVDDICCLLGRARKSITTSPAPSASENAEELYKRGREYYCKKDYTVAVPLLSKAAIMGNVEAQYNLGVCYKNGYGVNKDYVEAVRWYRKSAEQGNVRAQNNLGICYEFGEGVNKDCDEAVRWYRKAAEQGNKYAQCRVNDICCLLDRARKSITTSPAPSASENAEELYKRGREYYDMGDYTSAVPLLSKAAEQGNARAQNKLGDCYCWGKGVNQNDSEAVKWYRKAAEQNYPDAQYNLGWCYCYGHGVNQDYPEAVRWYRKAAEQGNKMAEYRLKKLGYS